MSSELAIAVRNVSKLYRMYEAPADRLKQMLWRGRRSFGDEFWALRDINFEVARGETVGIVGRNGSGKSTLLQIICGTATPTAGQVERYGRISALLELGSGFNPEFTGRENVFLNGSILGFSRNEMESRFDEIAGFADIGDFIDSPVKHYSSGMFARLAFSVAIHVDPEILIVDEILAVGDAAFQRRCLSKFYEVRDRGCSILFVSHDQYQVKSICHRALYLEKGKQKSYGLAGRVIDEYVIDAETTPSQVQASACEEPRQETISGARESTSHEEGFSEENGDIGAAALYPYKVERVCLTSLNGEEINEITTGDGVLLTMEFRSVTAPPPAAISFVFNLYRHDDFYVCGTTTLMDGLGVHMGAKAGKVTVRFPSLPLLGGRYKWRVAINDHGGFSVLGEARDVCEFLVADHANAVGLLNLERQWQVETQD